MPREARPKKPIRYAVVGLGYIAQAAVLPAFAHAAKNSSLEAIISSDPAKLDELGEKYQVAIRGSYDDLEECLGHVDAAYICTPNSEHAVHAVAAAGAGVHVLCEKPLAVTDAECNWIRQACADAGVKLMTAYRLHFEPLFLDVIDRVRRGHIGEARYFTSSFSMQAMPGGIRTLQATGGGTLYDLGVYCINTACSLFGSAPDRVFAYSVQGDRSGMPEVDDTTMSVLRFPGERLATFTASFAAADVSSFRVVGTEGDILVEPAYEYAEPLAYVITVGDKTVRKRGKKRDQFAAELLYFSDCILKNRAPEPSGEEGTRDVRIVEALYESARRGEPVSIAPSETEPAPTSAQAISQPPVSEPDLVHAEKPHS